MDSVGAPKSAVKNFLRTCWQWLKAQFSPALTFFLAFLFVATFVWVVFAAIVWPAQNARFFRQVLLVDKNRILEVWGPSILPAEETAAKIEFALHQTDISNKLFTITVTLPDEIIHSEEDNTFTRQVELHFSGTLADETQTLTLVNARTISGLVILKSKILLNGQVAGEEVALEESIDLGVEPTWRAVLRRYGGGGSEVPLFPLATLFISVAGWLYQETRRKREEEEKQEEKNRQSAQETWQRFREEIRSEQIERAAITLTSLEQGNLRPYLQENDVHVAQQILAMAAGNFEQVSGKNFLENWLEEAAAALAYATEHNPTNRQALESLLRQFPKDKLQNEGLRKRLETAQSVLGVREPLQGWDWPPPPPEVKLPPPGTVIAGIERNPFPFDTAEDEEMFLFAQGRPLFWAEHPLHVTLKTLQGVLLVQGEKGSGKTALALALGKYSLPDRRVFCCYLAGAPDPAAIRSALANRLLAFVEHLPSFLAFLGEEQRRLLACTLLSELPREILLARLENASEFRHWKWLERAPSDEIRSIWKAETTAHLRLLRQAVTGQSPVSFAETQWWLALQSCLRSLGFEREIYIVLDADDKFSWAWCEEMILPRRHHWADLGIHPIIFSSPLPARQIKEKSGLRTFELRWEEEHLKAMMKWRWDSLYHPKPLESLFSGQGLNTLLQLANSSPRRLIRLWDAVLSDKKNLPISKEDVQKAAERLQ